MSPLMRRRRRPRAIRHHTPEQIIRRNVLWGAATLLAAAIVVFLVFGGGVPGTGPKEVRILAKDAGVLRVGAATKVRVAGVDVGEVSGLEPAKGKPGFSQITVALKGDAPALRRDATVKIRPRLFLEGNFFLDVSPGSPGSPPLGDAAIPPGAVTLHVAADEVFSAFDAETRDNFKETLRAFGEGLEGGGAEALNRFLRTTPDALEEIETVTRATRGNRDGDLRRLVREAGGVLQNLEDHEAGLRGTIVDGRRAFDAFAAEQQGLRRTIRGLDTTTDELMPQLSRISAGIPSARALVADARPLARRLPSFLDIANPGLRSVQTLAESRDVQGLTAELRPALRTISRSAAPLGRFGADLRPVAKCVNDNVLPILNAVVPDGSLTTGLKAYEELGGTFTGLGSSTQSFDANGPWIRYSAGLGNQAISTSDGRTTLSAVAEQPVVGSTPTPVSEPPLRPDVPCETQGVPSLESRLKPFQGKQGPAKNDRSTVTEILDQGIRDLQEIGRDPARRRDLDRALRSLIGPAPTATEAGR